MPHVEKDFFILREHYSPFPILVEFMVIDIVMSVLRVSTSDYTFGIIKRLPQTKNTPSSSIHCTIDETFKIKVPGLIYLNGRLTVTYEDQYPWTLTDDDNDIFHYLSLMNRKLSKHEIDNIDYLALPFVLWGPWCISVIIYLLNFQS